MSTAITCTLYADGVRVADGHPGDSAEDPTALSALEITWGRETTVDQPAASTMSVDVMDVPGGVVFTDELVTGTRLDVTATGITYPDPDRPVWPDPGFEDGSAAVVATNATAAVTTRRPRTGDPRMRAPRDLVATRTNLATDPAATRAVAVAGLGGGQWLARWFGGGAWAGTTTAVTGAADGPLPGLGTYLRKAWTGAPESGAAQDVGWGWSAAAHRLPVTPGTTYTLSRWMRASIDAAGAWRNRLVVQPRDDDAVAVGTAISTADAAFAAGEWVRQWVTFTAPEGATWVELTGSIYLGTNSAAGMTLDETGLLIEEADTLGDYFDGDTPETETAIYEWTGEPNASTSIALPAGARSLELVPVDGARRASAIIAPAPFAAPGTHPDAWDEIPATTAGQPWGFGAAVWVPAWATVEVRPVLFFGPYAGSAVVEDGPVLVAAQEGTSPGDGAWHDLAGTFTVDVSGAWVGLQVSVFPTGPEWIDGAPAGAPWIAGAETGASWLDSVRVFVDNVGVFAPGDGIESTVLVFSGRVTDLDDAWDETTNCPVVHVNAADFTADLENVRVGDEPWLVETMSSRFHRVLDLAGTDVVAEIDDTVAAIPVSWRDVDSQGATGLLAELASTVDAIMWSATHQVTGPYLRVEDPTNRPPLFVLAMVDGLVRILPATTVAGAVDLSACDVLRESVRFTQNVADVATRAAVTWLEQGVDDEGQVTTTERTVTLVDATLEKRFGQRGYSLSTQLQAEGDAADVAGQLLARASFTGWRANGLVIDDDLLDTDPADMADQIELLLTLLDGTSRNGLPIRLVDLPAWAPAGAVVPCYLEGGKWAFDEGRWVLELTVSNASAQGQSGTWAEADPAWRWIDIDPAIAWDDLRGVGMPEGSPA